MAQWEQNDCITKNKFPKFFSALPAFEIWCYPFFLIPFRLRRLPPPSLDLLIIYADCP